MPGNLSASSKPTPLGQPKDPRPYQKGKLTGDSPTTGGPAEADKECLIDTGAAISIITWKNASKFKTKLKAGAGAGGVGGGAMEIYTGVTII